MTSTIPNYELYGELLAGGLPGPIHHETIKERSSKHNWTIRLHRHRRLAQIFLFSSAGVYLQVGDVEHTSTNPTLLVIPPGIAHGFLFSEDVVGDVISIRLDEMPEAIQHRFNLFSAATDTIFTKTKSGHFDHVTALVKQLRTMYRSVASNKSDVLTSLIDLITLYLADNLHEKNTLRPAIHVEPRSRHDLQIDNFCNLLEENFSLSWTVSVYAEKIGVSTPHLTRICRAELGSPPNDLVRQRRMLEAKRLLEYTALSIAEIAHRCGFRDAAFFSRTFKSNFGISPNHYRKQLDR